MNYVVLYVKDCIPSHKSFKTAKKAHTFIKNIANKPYEHQHNVEYITGLIIGKYKPANMDFHEKHLLKLLKKEMK